MDALARYGTDVWGEERWREMKCGSCARFREVEGRGICAWVTGPMWSDLELYPCDKNKKACEYWVNTEGGDAW